MDEAEVKKLFNRLMNFYADFDTSEDAFQNKLGFLKKITVIKNYNIEIAQNIGLSREELLYRVIADIFDFITEKNPYFAMFSNTDLFGILVESFSYWIICLYIHTLKYESESKSKRKPKRNRAISLSEFVYNNSISGYNKTGGMYQRSLDNRSDYPMIEESTFRKYRNRQFKDRKAQSKNKQWSAITNDSIHEWRLYYKLVYNSKDNNDLFETLKKLKKIGKKAVEMNTFTFTLDKNADIAELSKLYSDVISALKKISYVEVLNLYKFIVKHLQSEEKYYGINMFRLEKMLNPTNIIIEVNEMQNCKNSPQILKVLERYYHFNDISEFRLLYCFLGCIGPQYALQIKQSFLNVLYNYSPFFLIVLDDYVKNGIFGEDWESFFLNEINNIASNYYVLDDSLFETQSASQDNFQKLLQFTFQKAYEQKIAICKAYHKDRAFFTENSEK